MGPPRIACLTLDLEPDLFCSTGRIRLLEDDSKLESFRSLLRAEAVPLTCFTVMSIARRYVDRMTELARETKIEFAVHSFSHDRTQPASADEIDRSWDAYCDTWSAEPWGYRAPNCLIDEDGLHRLMRRGFKYDSSITPSVRYDRYGYDHRAYGRMPFVLTCDERRMVELPVACLALSRLPFVLSYIKLMGFTAYRFASTAMPLPPIAVTYFHPYDLYADEIAANIPGWKRYAHSRNGSRGLAILAQAIRLLKRRGYKFLTMQDLAAQIDSDPSSPARPIV